MSLLPILYWIILILSILGIFTPPNWIYGRYIFGFSATILFIIIGLRLFKVSLQ